MSVHTSKSGRPSGVLESVNMKTNCNNKQHKTTARLERLGLSLKRNIVSVCEPSGKTICMADAADIVKWHNEHAALEAVAEHCEKLRLVINALLTELPDPCRNQKK